MRSRTLTVALLTLFCLGLCPVAPAQQSALPITEYIHQSWDKLSRSMTECASVVDPKLTSAPVLYLPADEGLPASVKTMQQHCKVDVRHLPRPITHEGELMPDEIATPGLLYLPNRYVVPGGRFNEMYGWDSYFILLGELADGRVELARGTVENFFYEIDHYGSVLNANRTYFLTRSQPPLLSSMVLEVYHAQQAIDPKGARTWLAHALPYLQRDHALWVTAPHLAGSTGLSRYVDLGHGPVPEMADDSTYYVDVVRWLRAHPGQAPAEYLRKAEGGAKNCSGAGSAGKECLQTAADGEELTESFFSGDRAMRESGFDTTFRFGPFSGSAENFAPVCLNSLLYKYERDLAFLAATLGDRKAAVDWSSVAGERLARMEALMWDESAGLFLDYDFAAKHRSSYKYVTAFYALWAGVASPAQARRLEAALPLFERAGGLQMSTEKSGVQWDAPFAWAPTNWFAVEGLRRNGFDGDARRLAGKFVLSVENGYKADGTIREKYNAETASSDVALAAGYKSNVIGFGWTNGVYLRLQQLLAARSGLGAARSGPSPAKSGPGAAAPRTSGRTTGEPLTRQQASSALHSTAE